MTRRMLLNNVNLVFCCVDLNHLKAFSSFNRIVICSSLLSNQKKRKKKGADRLREERYRSAA